MTKKFLLGCFLAAVLVAGIFHYSNSPAVFATGNLCNESAIWLGSEPASEHCVSKTQARLPQQPVHQIAAHGLTCPMWESFDMLAQAVVVNRGDGNPYHDWDHYIAFLKRGNICTDLPPVGTPVTIEKTFVTPLDLPMVCIALDTEPCRWTLAALVQ